MGKETIRYIRRIIVVVRGCEVSGGLLTYWGIGLDALLSTNSLIYEYSESKHKVKSNF